MPNELSYLQPAMPCIPFIALSPVANRPPKAPVSETDEYSTPYRRPCIGLGYQQPTIEAHMSIVPAKAEINLLQKTMPGRNPASATPRKKRTASRPGAFFTVDTRQHMTPHTTLDTKDIVLAEGR